MTPFHKIVLDNGLRVVLVPQKNSRTTTALFLVEAGSKYETKETNGVSHFLEHMCFKGTVRRPKPMLISSELDAIGAEYNAFTGQEYTGYYAKARNEDLPRVFDLLSDIYLNSTLDAGEIDRERGVIIEEINMNEDSPMHRIHELLTTVLYDDQPAGWDIAGKKEIIASLPRDAFVSYRSRRYVPATTVLTIAGGFDPRAAESLIRKTFSAAPAKTADPMPRTDDTQTRPRILVQKKSTDQAHLMIGIRTVGASDPRRFALSLAANILGGWMSSRLFQRIRAEMGAAYYVHASHATHADHGYLSVTAGVTLAKLPDVVSAIVEELTKLRETPVTEAELSLAKGNVVGRTIVDLETSDALANFYGSQEVIRREILTIEQLLAKIKGVAPDDIQGAARELFVTAHLNAAIIGPYDDGTKLEPLLLIN